MKGTFWAVLLALIIISPAYATISYHVTALPLLSPPLVRVDMQFTVPQPEQVVLEAPAWSPGDYQLQFFGKYVTSLSASDSSGIPLVIHRSGASYEWHVYCHRKGTVRVEYFVPNEPPGNFSQNVQISRDLVFINGPAALLYIPGRTDEPCNLTVSVPHGWLVSSPLTARGAPDEHTWTASGYDQLSDAPLVAATQLLTYHFADHGCNYSLIFFDHLNTLQDPARWVPVFQRIAHSENDLMQITPYRQYYFLLDVGGGLGGLEHMNSCRLAYSPGLTPDEYAPFVAHELFHSWNVKRLRPALLGPFNYQQPAKTRCLWFAEGITEYFAWIACRRAGLISIATFEHHFRGLIARYLANPARNRISADTASLMVWTNKESTGYRGLSYYDQGELIGLCFDLNIRHLTNQKSDLASLMRYMYKLYSPPKPGYRLQDIAAALNEITGTNLTQWFMRMADSTEQLPLQQCLAYAGLDLSLEPTNGNSRAVAVRNSWER